MSLIGLLTATEKQVHLGQLHMRPIQWNLENQKKGDLNPKIFPSTIKMVSSRGKCPTRSATTPTEPCSSDLYRCLKRSLARSLRRPHGKRDLVLARKQVTHKLTGTKGNLLALKEFQDFCSNKILFIATDNTSVVAYMRKEA